MCATKAKTARSTDRMESLWHERQKWLGEYVKAAEIADDDPKAPKGSPGWRSHQSYSRYRDAEDQVISTPAQDVFGMLPKFRVLSELIGPEKDPGMLTNRIILTLIKDCERLAGGISGNSDAKLIAVCDEHQKTEAEWNTYGKRKAPFEKKLFQLTKKGVGEREARRKSGLPAIEREERKVIARSDRLAARIVNIPAQTLEGLAYKVKVALDEAAIVNPEAEDHFPVLVAVAEDVKRLAQRVRS